MFKRGIHGKILREQAEIGCFDRGRRAARRSASRHASRRQSPVRAQPDDGAEFFV